MNLKEAKKCFRPCVYCLDFPNGKSYVGKTKDLGKRMRVYEKFADSCNKELSFAISEYGWDNIDIRILVELKVSDAVSLELCLSILEIRYIREMNTIMPNGYNISLGGEVLGIPIEYLTTDKDFVKSYSTNAKVLLAYDLRGDFVEEFPSISRFAYEKGVEEDGVRLFVGKMKPFKEQWYLREKRYDYIPNHIEVPYYEVKERVKYKDVIETRVIEKERVVFTYAPALKYDMNGDFCGEYSNKSEACRTFLNNSNVGWAEYRNGYILFKKIDDNYPKKIEPYYILQKKVLKDYYVPIYELEDKIILDTFTDIDNHKHALCVDGKYTNIKHQFRVGQYTLNGELVKTFDSIRDASHETGIRYSQIYACVKGTVKKASGFLWKKLEE
jgi:hypothetical protein